MVNASAKMCGEVHVRLIFHTKCTALEQGSSFFQFPPGLGPVFKMCCFCRTYINRRDLPMTHPHSHKFVLFATSAPVRDILEVPDMKTHKLGMILSF